VTLLRDYQDIFAWSYQDMPGLSSEIVQHKLPLNPKCSPIKQKLRRMKLEMSLKIKEEVKKQFDAGFLVVAWYPKWVATRHGKKTRTRGYPFESVQTLTGNTRVDRVWVRIRVFPDNQKSGTGTGMRLLDSSRPRTRTHPAT